MNRLTTDDGVIITFPSDLNGYKYICPIGVGSSSVVVLVESNSTHDLYASKIIRRDKTIDKNTERELRFLQYVRHPNIVTVYDIIYLPDIICAIMEYCPRGDLISELGKVGRLPQNQLKSYCFQLISAIAFLHDNGWAHRDLKPDNILIDSSGRIKLADFGQCGEINRKNPMMNTLCGTFSYVPPEVMQEKPYDGKKADIWALGVVMFCMASGQLPWGDGSTQQITDRILRADMIDLPDIDKDCLRLIRMCIVVDPFKRASAKEILEDDWFTQVAWLQKTTSMNIKPLLTSSTTRFNIKKPPKALKKHSLSLYNFTFK